MTNDRKSGYQRAISREFFTEVACDYVLPDYLGEVRKILYTEARAMPLPTYMNGEEACASGGVRFRMVYTDAEGQISSVEFSEDYEMRERIACGEIAGICADTTVENSSMRLLGPRKISAKARVCAMLTVLTNEAAELSGSAFEVGDPELADMSVTVLRNMSAEPTEREYAEGLVDLDGVIADEVRVIYESATPVIAECRAAEDEIWVSGEHRVHAMIAVGDAHVCLYNKTVPFAETLVLDGARAEMNCKVGVSIPSLKINITPTDVGVSLVASLIAEFTPIAYGNQTITLVTDGYMTDRQVACEYSDIDLQSLCVTMCEREAFRCEATHELLSVEPSAEVVYMSAEPRVKSLEVVGDRVKIMAEIRFSGIACEISGEKNAYVPIRHSAEWNHEIPIESAGECSYMPIVSLHCTAAFCEVTDSGVALCSELCLDFDLIARRTHQRLCRIDAVGEVERRDNQGRILVYYPDGEDTLFSVAQRFHTTPRRIAIDNALTEATLADRSSAASLRGIEKLIIK